MSSFSSISGSAEAKSYTEISKNAHSHAFWEQFLRGNKQRGKKSMFSNIKKCLLRKKRKTQEIPGNHCFNTVSSQSHPPGLYCVIDDFLSTYSDGSEFTTEDDGEEYGEVVDTVEHVRSDDCQYSEILDARHYQNLSDMHNLDIGIEKSTYLLNEDNLINTYSSSKEEYETSVD